MRFVLVDQAKNDFPVHRLCRCLASAKAAISPGRIVRPAVGNRVTW